MATELITSGTAGVGLQWWLAPIFLLVGFWVAGEADKQAAAKQTSGQASRQGN